MYGFLSEEEYVLLHRETQRAVKAADPALRFGGPGIEGSLLLDAQDGALARFLEACRREDCLPDFVTMHSFPHAFHEIAQDFNRMVHRNDGAASFRLSGNEHFMRDCVDAMHRALAALSLGGLPVLIDEWNATIWQRDLCSDTCYKAAYVVKNLVETMGRTVGSAYWTVSDLIHDWKLADTLFHGGHGIFTCNGVPKPVFYAYELLARMGDELLSRGDGWLVTRGGGALQILLYHYCHYNTMYRVLSALGDPDDRYSAFREGAPVEYHLVLRGLPEGAYQCEYRTISRADGSAYDEWVAMGAPDVLTAEGVRELKRRAVPALRLERRTSLHDLQITLEPLSVVQVTIRPDGPPLGEAEKHFAL